MLCTCGTRDLSRSYLDEMRTPPRRVTAAAAVILATAFGGTLSTVASAEPAPDRGDGAVAQAADRYGVSEAALSKRLRLDPTFRLTPSGVAISIDPAPTSVPTPARPITQAVPLEETFELHSKADSSKTIYLDFNGQIVSNTIWNTNFDGVGPGQPVPNGQFHPAMDLAGDGTAFNNNELLQIQDIYQRVAEDYAPFDVDVTTEEPPAGDIDRSNANDQVYGTRALISPSKSAVNSICGGGCGGVAFVGVFNHYTGKDNFVETHSQLQPAWVFPQALGNDPKKIAEATTHEVGHNLGLDHDATSVQGYYAGHDSWAPIMGVGYDRPITQFARSDYPDADLGGPNPSLQANPDDIVTVTQFGAAFRTDEPGTSSGTAGAVPAGGGYISRRTDVDYFNLGTCSGNVTVTANNAPVSPNLDIQLQLLNSRGTAIDTDNPLSALVDRDIASGLDATSSGTSLPSGTYYARVDGIGRGNATTSYTDYGSVGAYSITSTGCDGIVQPPQTTKPGKPRIGKATAGRRGGAKTAKIAWRPPAAAANPAINGYRIIAYRVNNRGKYVKISSSPVQGPGVHSIFFTSNSSAKLKFAVKARNALGFGALSAKSNAVRPR